MKYFKNPWKVFLALLSITALGFGGCSVLQQIQQMATFARCEFRLASVGNTTLAGVDIQGLSQPSDIGLEDMANLGAAFAGGSLPLEFTLNMEVRNPNPSMAAMNKLAWILYLNNDELTSGLLTQRVEIPAQNGVGTVPVAISVDLLQVFSGRTLRSMLNLALTVAGEGNEPTKLTLKMKPSIMIADQPMDYPGYIAVSHTFTSQESKEIRQDVLNRLNKSSTSN